MRRLRLIVVLAIIGWSGVMPPPALARADRSIAVDILSADVDGEVLWINIEVGNRSAQLLLAGIQVASCMLPYAARRLDGLAAGQGGLLELAESRWDSTGTFLQGYLRVDGVMLNLLLVREGYAVARPTAGDYRYHAELENAEAYARYQELRLWRECAYISGASVGGQRLSARAGHAPGQTAPGRRGAPVAQLPLRTTEWKLEGQGTFGPLEF